MSSKSVYSSSWEASPTQAPEQFHNNIPGISGVRLPSIKEIFPDFFDTRKPAPQYNSEGYCRNYAFIPLAERDRKPRPRRRFEEVERLYACVHPGCDKAYGALNHLNSHIVSKNHGPKRTPQEFEEMRRAIKERQNSYQPFIKQEQATIYFN